MLTRILAAELPAVLVSIGLGAIFWFFLGIQRGGAAIHIGTSSSPAVRTRAVFFQETPLTTK